MSDARWNDPREYDARNRDDEWPRVYDARNRDEYDPRNALMRNLDLPRGDERELVVDRDRVYELDGEDSRTLAAVGAFRIVPEHDLALRARQSTTRTINRFVGPVKPAGAGPGRPVRPTGPALCVRT